MAARASPVATWASARLIAASKETGSGRFDIDEHPAIVDISSNATSDRDAVFAASLTSMIILREIGVTEKAELRRTFSLRTLSNGR